MSNKLITLAPGTAVYPAITRPDTKFHALGAYKANVKMSESAAAPFMKIINDAARAYLGKVLPKTDNPCWKRVVDDDGEETGEIEFKIGVKNQIVKATGKTWDRKPLVIDSKKKEMPTDVAVWGGSKIRVQAEIDEWEFSGKKGISLRPMVVQVLELVTGGDRNDLSAFDEEDGFETDSDLGAFDNEDSSGHDSSDDNDDY